MSGKTQTPGGRAAGGSLSLPPSMWSPWQLQDSQTSHVGPRCASPDREPRGSCVAFMKSHSITSVSLYSRRGELHALLVGRNAKGLADML